MTSQGRGICIISLTINKQLWIVNDVHSLCLIVRVLGWEFQPWSIPLEPYSLLIQTFNGPVLGPQEAAFSVSSFTFQFKILGNDPAVKGDTAAMRNT